MGTFVDAALGFPAVLFTIFLVPVVVYWLTVLLGVVDVDLSGEGEIDALDALDAPDAGGDSAEGAGGALASWWQGLGLADVPITVAVSFVVVCGWFVALLATGWADASDVSPLVRLLAGLVVAVVAAVAGTFAAAALSRPLRRLFATTEAETRDSFVGRTCRVRTSVVTDRFGQAEATDPLGATVLLQVRATEAADRSALGYGTEALIVDYDAAAEAFLICPVEGVLGDVGT